MTTTEEAFDRALLHERSSEVSALRSDLHYANRLLELKGAKIRFQWAAREGSVVYNIIFHYDRGEGNSITQGKNLTFRELQQFVAGFTVAQGVHV